MMLSAPSMVPTRTPHGILGRMTTGMPRPAHPEIVVLALLCLASLAGCAPATNPLEHSAARAWCCTVVGEHSAGFWLGLWHGVAAPITFLISLLSPKIGVYEVHNNGGWYNCGFLLGVSMVLGGSASGRGYYSRRGRR
jgi:hypothetical protein